MNTENKTPFDYQTLSWLDFLREVGRGGEGEKMTAETKEEGINMVVSLRCNG